MKYYYLAKMLENKSNFRHDAVVKDDQRIFLFKFIPASYRSL